MGSEKNLSGAPRQLSGLPALAPCLGLLVGVSSAPHLVALPAFLAALLGLGLSLRGKMGWLVAGLAVGWLLPGLQTLDEPVGIGSRPVELHGVVERHPIVRPAESFFHVRVGRWRQGHRVELADFSVGVTLPADSAPPGIGSTVRLRGYLKRSTGFANAEPARPGPWRMRLKSAHFLAVIEPPSAASNLASTVRGYAEETVDRAANRSGKALLRALVLGDRTQMPKSWLQALRRCGLAHLLAVSGLHVGLLAFLLLLPSSRLPRALRYLPSAMGMVLYLLIVGPQPAILRASWMGALCLLAWALHRPPVALNSLASVVVILVLFDSSLIDELGFQLTVAATGGILILSPAFAERWTLLPRTLRQPIAVTVAAQLATLPWTTSLSGGVHPAAPLLNLLAIPYLAVCLTVFGFWCAVAAFFPELGTTLSPMLDVVAVPVALLTELQPGPFYLMPLSLSSGATALALAMGLYACLHPLRASRCALLVVLLLLTGAGPREQQAIPEVTFLDVGQGDAVLLRHGSQAVLIDGGGWPHGDLGGRVLVPALAALGVRSLHALVLTHPDTDHCRGLVDVAYYLRVAELWMSPGWLDEPCAADLLAAPVRHWRPLWGGDTEDVGDWSLRVLHPEPGKHLGGNDGSLVLRAEIDGWRVLLTGDIEAEAERRLLARRGIDLRADVLKVAHHGSRTSTSYAFVQRVQPSLALISVGGSNPYGHPRPEIVERLTSSGARVLRTDEVGWIRMQRMRTGGGQRLTRLQLGARSSP